MVARIPVNCQDTVKVSQELILSFPVRIANISKFVKKIVVSLDCLYSWLLKFFQKKGQFAILLGVFLLGQILISLYMFCCQFWGREYLVLCWQLRVSYHLSYRD